MKATYALCAFVLLGSVAAQADLYQWTDAQGVTHVVDDERSIPEAYRSKVKTYRTPKSPNPAASLIAPSRTYAENSQGAFAQKLALDLGLIKSASEDALGPLSTVGIQPAGGWSVDDPLTPEAHYEIIAAARRAAESRRIPLSADGAEAVVRQAAASFLPPASLAQSPPPLLQDEEEANYDQEADVIIEQQPPQVIEVIREPMYMPAPVYVPAPVIVGGPPSWRHRHDRGPGGRLQTPRRAGPQLSPGFSTPAPTHMPFGTSQMPFGASQMPFGANQMPFRANRGSR